MSKRVQVIRTTEDLAHSVAVVIIPWQGWAAAYDCHATADTLDDEKYEAAVKHPVGDAWNNACGKMTLEQFADRLLDEHVARCGQALQRGRSVCVHHPGATPARDCPDACYHGGFVTMTGDIIEHVERRRANDTQVGGTHYVRHGEFQPWDAWWLWGLNAFQGAVVKYVVRYREKGGVEDLRKAVHYLEKLIECEEAARAVPEGQEGHGGVRGGDGPK